MNDGLHTPDCIRTFTGIYVNVFQPTVDMIRIEDIAHALSHQCRFSGHTKEFYSVAQHSVLCSEIVDKCGDYDNVLPALLHDSPEAYLVDVPTPIKYKLADYKPIENNLMKVIAERFSFPFPFDKIIKQADEMMLQREWEQLMIGNVNHFTCWSPKEAKEKFLETFYELSK